MTTSRERVRLALQHKEADRVPLDLGASAVTGMQVDTVYGLRQALGLDRPSTPVGLIEQGAHNASLQSAGVVVIG